MNPPRREFAWPSFQHDLRERTLEIDSARTRRKVIHLRAAQMRQRKKQVRGWRILRDDMPVAFEPAAAAAHDYRGWVVPVMRVAVAHTAAPIQNRVIQQGAVALF